MLEKLLNFGRKLIPRPLFRLGQPVYHWLLAISGNIIYRFPGRKIKVIGITGTNGKSTTVELVNSVLKTAGFKTGMISTIGIEIAGTRIDNTSNRTTLGRWQTPRFLRRMVKAGCEYAVIEVASEGIAWHRTWGIPFDVAVFTNLSPEHLNFHKTMVRYRNTKGKLFANLSLGSYKKKRILGKKVKIEKVSVVNADDKEANYFGAFPADRHIFYGLKKGELKAKNLVSKEGISFTVEYQGKNTPVNSALWGSFNAYNILAAWAVGLSQGIDQKKIKEGVAAVKKVSGRLEEVPTGKGFRIFVDYAMTPDAYEMVFEELRRITKARLMTVFGAAGERDRTKRPVIGEVAAKKADYIILTDDEPYGEDPKKIIEEIETGVKKVTGANYKVIPDRKKALGAIIKEAKSGDVIVVPGMGHEKFRNVGKNKRIPWDEVKIIQELLK
jgi:UDP-N-acetylmuramoyl-L-alanyl-D-glutamate--2,6-diaminopimelate ligase